MPGGLSRPANAAIVPEAVVARGMARMARVSLTDRMCCPVSRTGLRGGESMRPFRGVIGDHPGKVGILQFCVGQVGSAEYGSVKDSPGEVGFPKVGVGQVGVAKGGLQQGGVGQVGSTEYG
jgi:hypothetical protein